MDTTNAVERVNHLFITLTQYILDKSLKEAHSVYQHVQICIYPVTLQTTPVVSML